VLETRPFQLVPGGYMFFSVISKEALLPGGGTREIYDDESVRRELGPFGLVDISRIDELGAARRHPAVHQRRLRAG
jgi:hypothetical protein